MTVRRRLLPLLAVLPPLAACHRTPSETYGFIATLGNDTTSVERVTRTGDRVVGDAVGRSPVVVRRHWVATLAPDGTVRHFEMETHVPNAPPGQGELRHTADFDARATRLSTIAGRDTIRATYAKTYATTVPWNAFLYGTYELLFDVARGRPDSTRIGQYFFEGWDEGHVGYARVGKRGGDRYSIHSTGLSGTGEGRLDAQGHLVSYSGQGTTYKQEVRRVTDVPDLDAVAARFAAQEKASGGVPRALSERDTARGTLGGTAVTIDYSRPLARGRTLVGGLIPYDHVWRTGANAATQLTVTGPVALAGVALDSGTYTLWTLPSRHGVQLIINRQTGQWGTEYHAQRDLARVPLEVDTLPASVERFTVRVEPDRGGAAGRGATNAGRLVLEWGTFRWSAPLVPRNRS